MAIITSSQKNSGVSKKRDGVGFLPVAAGLFLTILLGVLIGLSSPFLIVLFVGMILGSFFLLMPRFAVWVVIIGSIVLSGLTELYLPQFQQTRWGISLLSLVLIGVSFVSAVFNHQKSNPLSSAAIKTLIAAIILFAAVILTLVANPAGISNSFVGLKNYFQMFGILFALAFFRYTPDDSKRFMQFLFVLSLIQLPFVIQQFLVLVPIRNTFLAAQQNIVAVDIVAGTFGGAKFGGGRSSTLALLQSIALIIVLLKWYSKEITTTKSAILGLVMLAPMALNEAKLFIVLLPVGIFITFRKQILKYPIRAILAVVLMVNMLFGLLFVYSLLPGEHFTSFSAFIDDSMSYNIGDKGYGSAVLNRTTVYSFWWDQHIGKGDILHSLFGHGLGQTNSAGLGVENNLSNTTYAKYFIGLTAVSALLWEVGLVGTSSFLLVLWFAYQLGSSLSKTWQGTSHWIYIKAAQIAVAMTVVSMFHNNYLIADMSTQALIMLVIGYLLAMSRKT